MLSKPAIGDYIGDGDKTNVKVMRAFIDSMSFANQDFVQALRIFLQSFRLPGEAQKIDRLMEKFADRYCETNPTIFAKADTAYTLAFSVIMLNTDQHSNHIKVRMDPAAFIKNNRGINDEGDLPDEFLQAIFHEISTNEIIMQDEGKVEKMSMGWGAGTLNEQQRKELYRMEAATIQKKSELMMHNVHRNISPFKTANTRDLARPMFVTSSWAMMAALALQFESSMGDQTDAKADEVCSLCLDGIVGGIKIACHYQLEMEKDAYLSSLAKFSNLSDFNALAQKNIDAILALIHVVNENPGDLDKSWIHVIKLVSQLDRLQLAVSQASLERYGAKRQLIVDFAESLREQEKSKIIDKIFTNSPTLTATSIIQFFKAVCHVSLEEVGMDGLGKLINDHSPRMYLLQKIVETAYYNMERIRYEWTQIWRILQPHFNMLACHPNQDLATFAVDSLRQLGMKILEREELGHFSSQHEYLKSFEYITKNTSSHLTRELVLSSVCQMINVRADSIRSGWRSILLTLLKTAQSDATLSYQAFGVMQMVFKNHFEDLVAANVFVELVSCLAEFALIPGQGPTHDEQVMGSIQLLQSCTKSLMARAEEEERDVPAKSDHGVTLRSTSSAVMLTSPHAPRINNLPLLPYLLKNGKVSEEHFYLSWFPILSALSRVVTESDGMLVRTHTLESLFETLRSCAPLFEPSYWKAIQRNVISPIFDDLSESITQETNVAVLILGLRLLADLLSTNLERLDFLKDSLSRMVKIMGEHDEKLASTGQTCLHQFMLKNSENIAHMETLDWLFETIDRGFAVTVPYELINCEPQVIMGQEALNRDIVDYAQSAARKLGEPITLDSLNFQQTVIKCVTHLEWISTIRTFSLSSITNGTTVTPLVCMWPKQHARSLLDNLYVSYAMARAFNGHFSLRQSIFKRGWVAQLPNLVKQETTCFQAYIMTLFALVKSPESEEFGEILIFQLSQLLKRCELFCTDPAHTRDLNSWSGTLVLVFKELGTLKNNLLIRRYLPRFYRSSLKLLASEQPVLRGAILEYLTAIADILFPDGDII